MADVIAYFNTIEGDICLRVNRLSHRIWLRRFFSVISRLGNGGFWVLAGLALLPLQGKAALPAMLQIALTAGVGIVVYKLLKNRLVRERPYINHRGILCGAVPLDRYSFPSGHTLHAASLTILLCHFEPLLLPVVLPFAVLVAASRIVLGLHYPSDVAVGAVIGAALAAASLQLFPA